jgi:hypothetical protein
MILAANGPQIQVSTDVLPNTTLTATYGLLLAQSVCIREEFLSTTAPETPRSITIAV